MKLLLILGIIVYSLSAFSTTLNKEELQVLINQNYLVKTNRDTNEGMIIFDINKSIDTVMQQIVNLEAYPSQIEDVDNVIIYSKQKNIIKAKIFISTFFIDFHNSVIHTIDMDKHTMHWDLDDKEDNYFYKMNGSWQLKRVNNKTRVSYINHLEFKSWIPSFIEDYLFEKGLFKSTQWLVH